MHIDTVINKISFLIHTLSQKVQNSAFILQRVEIVKVFFQLKYLFKQ